MDSSEEKRLIDELRVGSASAFEQLVRENVRPMLSAARRILRNDEDARDAVQDAFLRAFENLDGFEGGSRISTSLHRIAVNAALMKLRSRRGKREDPIEPLLPRFLPDGHRENPEPAWDLDPGDELDQRRRNAFVRAQIDRLPESYRTVLLLRDVEDLSTEEAARALGIGPDAVKMRLHRARPALRCLIDPEMRPEAA
jgi:RNA polymerase sigma-70 factor (ECF subfamily)